MRMKSDLVYSQHVFRASIDDDADVPMVAPTGQRFMLASRPGPSDKLKRYFVAAPRNAKTDAPQRIMTCLNQAQAMMFTNLRVAESYANFINNQAVFPDGAEFWIVLEPVGYMAEAPRGRLQSVAS